MRLRRLRRPSWWCEVHHLLFWAFGGETSLENSGLLCERHHTQVHHGFTIARDEDGRWHTHRPDGTEIIIRSSPWLDPGGGPAEAPAEQRHAAAGPSRLSLAPRLPPPA